MSESTSPQAPPSTTEKAPVIPSQTPSETTPPVVDVQAQINAALAKQQADFTAKAEEEKLKAQGEFQKIAENKTAEVAQYKARLEQVQIANELLLAATESLDPDTVMALLQNKASVDASGNVLVDGKTAKDAVSDLLKAKPYLAKSTGIAGSGSPISTAPQQPATVYADAAKNRDVLGMLAANTGVKA